jgi:hypothetical protein
MTRRHFIKILGIGSLAFAPACTSRPEKNLFSQVQAPEDMVTASPPGMLPPAGSASAGCGILAKNKKAE